MAGSPQTLAYTRPSELHETFGGLALGLETAGGFTPVGAEAHPTFFAGFLTSPQAAARGLLAVADVAATRYYQAARPGLLDPVVTGNGDRLRFESFSGCCGVYARLDVLQDGLDGAETGHGTTNVDVNAPLRTALSRITDGDPLHLRVGPDELAVTTMDGQVVEKKGRLPDRWLRGFAEAQVVSAQFDLRAELSAAEAARFLRSLSRSSSASRGAMWVVPAGRSLRLTARPVVGAVCLPGPERLAALQQVLRHATRLRVFGPAPDGMAATASAWELTLPGMRLTLTLSPEAGRGFSGEGAVLEALATDEAAEDAEAVALLLSWEPRVDPVDLSERSGLTVARVKAALTRLGTSGRVGYDIADACYFHREMPYDTDRAERHNPRLVAARSLFSSGAVRLDGTLAAVASADVTYLVREQDGALSCTCRWWADHRGRRGPCKHALAVRIARRATADGTR
ncbi:SWIM zinc finger domain-containing protein (plasmid) [Streptomyces sp. HUAS 31]|uniref:SWIM zinc finger family protein n=1 Tax=Streptomyces sp. HUAS 31 TaxID=3020055 RepID=UPI002305FFFA|nr:SWIM zinc finger family protein [Streptomyces sp. HUAS 31]WCE02515.1 SWIM zinc finger domain-containing protein [Streptomyces sp. HUAS 31]